MKKLICIIGKSGSGKSTIVNKLGYKRIISHTTREQRDNEISGKDYYFYSKEFYKVVNKESVFEGVYDDKTNSYYWTYKDQYDFEGIRIIIVTPEGYEKIKTKFDGECVGIYLECSYEERYNRLSEPYDEWHDGILGIDNFIEFVVEYNKLREVLDKIEERLFRDEGKFNIIKDVTVINAEREIDEIVADIERVIGGKAE